MEDWVVSLGSMIWAGATIVLMIGTAVVGFLFFKNRAVKFFNVLLIGLLAGAVASMLLPSCVGIIINYIPDVSNYLAENEKVQSGISIGLNLVCELGGILVGYIFLNKNTQKNHGTIEIGEILAFGFSYYLVNVLMGSIISYAMEFIANAVSFNELGLQGTIDSVLSADGNTYTEEQVRSIINAYAETDGVTFFLSGLVAIFGGVINTCMAVVCYGAFTKKLRGKFHIAYTLECLVFVIPNVLSLFVEISNIAYTVISFVIAALAGAFTWYLICTFFPEEWKRFLVKKDDHNSFFGGPRKEEPKKMPKIVMPD